MLKTGIVSVTFRKLDPKTIIDLTKANGLGFVEWGGDIHVPPTDIANAENVGNMTRAGGLDVISYGSYFRAGVTPQESFAAELAAAKALKAPNIRVWAGSKGNEDADANDRSIVASSLRACSEACAKENMTLSVEFHQHTLTDHYDSAVRLVHEVAADNFRLYWQPNQGKDTEYNLAAVRAVAPYLSNVHVFTWEGRHKFPLIHGEDLWRQYIDVIANAPGDHGLLLEFMCDGSEAQYVEDAKTLLSWIR